jgi:hypothetical protein
MPPFDASDGVPERELNAPCVVCAVWCVLHGVGGEAQQAHSHREAQAGTVAKHTIRLPISERASLRSSGVSVARPSC